MARRRSSIDTLKMGYQVSLVFEEDGLIKESDGRNYDTLTKAMAAAKKLAGRSAKFVRKGVSIMYVGPNGAAYIS